MYQTSAHPDGTHGQCTKVSMVSLSSETISRSARGGCGIQKNGGVIDLPTNQIYWSDFGGNMCKNVFHN